MNPHHQLLDMAVGKKLDSMFYVFEYVAHDLAALIDSRSEPFAEAQVGKRLSLSLSLSLGVSLSLSLTRTLTLTLTLTCLLRLAFVGRSKASCYSSWAQ